MIILAGGTIDLLSPSLFPALAAFIRYEKAAEVSMYACLSKNLSQVFQNTLILYFFSILALPPFPFHQITFDFESFHIFQKLKQNRQMRSLGTPKDTQELPYLKL